MPWLIALNVALYIGAGILFFTGYGILVLICFILACILSLVLTRGAFDLSDILFFLD
jgi:hypothetical protein